MNSYPRKSLNPRDKPRDTQPKYWPKLAYVLQTLIGWQNTLSLISIVKRIVHWYVRRTSRNMELTQVPYQNFENEYESRCSTTIGVTDNTRRRWYAWRMMHQSDAHSTNYLNDSIAYSVEDRIGYLRLQSVQLPLFPLGIAGVLTMVRSQKPE